MPAHKPVTKTFVMSDDHRVKIQNSNILKRLLDAGEGKLELSPAQITLGLGLMKKVLPDLASLTVSGDEKNPLKMTLEWLKPSE